VAKLRKEGDFVKKLLRSFLTQSHVHVEPLDRNIDAPVQHPAVHDTITALPNPRTHSERFGRNCVAKVEPRPDLLLEQRGLQRARVLSGINRTSRLDRPYDREKAEEKIA